MAATKTASKAEVEVTPKVIDIRHVVRKIGNMTVEGANIMSSPDFELYLKEVYFDDGWDIQGVFFLKAYPGAQYGVDFDPMEMLYVLVKRAA